MSDPVNKVTQAIVPYVSRNPSTEQAETKKTNIQALPDYILQRIFRFLSVQDLGSVSRVSPLWYALSEINSVWIYPCAKADFISIEHKEDKKGNKRVEITYRNEKHLLKTVPLNDFDAKKFYRRKTTKARAANRKALAQRKRNQKESLLLQLPEEILRHICTYLSARGLTSVATASALLQPIADDPYAWIDLCEKEGFLSLKQEGNRLKISYKGKEFALSEKTFNAKKVFHKKMQSRIDDALLINDIRILGKTRTREIDTTLSSPPFYDTERKEQEIYDNIKITAEALVKKVCKKTSEIERHEMEKSTRLVLAFQTMNPRIVISVLARDGSQALPSKEFCKKVQLEPPIRYVIRSNDPKLLQIITDLGFSPTEKDLYNAISSESFTIIKKFIEAKVPIGSKVVRQVVQSLGGITYRLYRLSKIKKKQKLHVELTKKEKHILKEEGLRYEQSQYLEILLLLCERLQVQEAKGDDPEKQTKIRLASLHPDFWEEVLQCQDLDLIKKFDSLVERPRPYDILQTAFETKNSEIAMYFLEEHLTQAKEKGTPQSTAGVEPMILTRLWGLALEHINDLEFIKKMEIAFIRPESLLELACEAGTEVGNIAIITHFLDQKLPVTTKCFNLALVSGNKELFDLLSQKEKFAWDNESGPRAIKGNNIELVKAVASEGYTFTLSDLLGLHSDEQGEQIAEFLRKEDKLSFDSSEVKASVIQKLALKSNLSLLTLLFEMNIVGNETPMDKKTEKELHRKRKQLKARMQKIQKKGGKVPLSMKKRMKELAPFSNLASEILLRHLVEWIKVYKECYNKKKPARNLLKQTKAVSFLLKQGIKIDDRSNELIFGFPFSKDLIKSAVEKLEFPIPKNVYSLILNSAMEDIRNIREKDIQNLKAIYSYLSSKGYAPQTEDLQILQNEINQRSSAEKYQVALASTSDGEDSSTSASSVSSLSADSSDSENSATSKKTKQVKSKEDRQIRKQKQLEKQRLRELENLKLIQKLFVPAKPVKKKKKRSAKK